MTATAALRILDANFNRASEGLRVIEDYARFVLEDRFLCGELKSVRHELRSAIDVLSSSERLAARDTPGDVGTEVQTDAEYRRGTVGDVAAANSERVQQALRAMEEFAKVGEFAATGLATRVEALRYRVYTLMRAVLNSRWSREVLGERQLYVLIDGGPSETALVALAEQLVASGVPLLQLRDKRLGDRELLARARRLRSVTCGTATRFIMNDRVDLAVLADADGVHLGQDELSVADARRIVGPQMWIGVSTHSLAQARAAVRDGASYLGCGPTFRSTTKDFAEFPGLPFLRQVREEIGLPAFAIGGISAENLDQVLATGFQRIAVSGAVCQAPDPAWAVRDLLCRLDATRGRAICHKGDEPG